MRRLRTALTRGLLTWRSLRALPARQVGHLVRARIVAPRLARAPRLGAVPSVEPSFRFRVPPLASHRCQCGAADIAVNWFTFLNETAASGPQVAWNDAALPLLWRYNLHYFDYLWHAPWPEAERLIRDWIQANPCPASPAWDPYPLSVRAMNWVMTLAGRFRADFADAPSGARELILRSLYAQGLYLRRHLERHLDGNHLYRNAAALYLLGRFFRGRAAGEWRDAAARLLAELTARHFLADGGHIERSPMYHALALLDLLHVLNAAAPEDLDGALHGAALRDAARRAAGFLAQMADADGEVLLLNDSAHGIAPPVPEILDYATRVLGEDVPRRPAGAAAFPDTGYHVLRHGGDVVVVDAGEVGPACQPGHAHGDIFSFLLTLDGHPVVVDSGVGTYERGPLRDYCRSTAAHNTVELDGEDQCEFWAAFRVARRGRPRDVLAEARNGGFRLSGWHDGYRRLRGSPVHHRELLWRPGTLVVRDTVEGRGEHAIASRLHLHPDCQVELRGDREAAIRYPSGEARLLFDGPGQLDVEPGWYCPQFGLKLRAPVLAFRAKGSRWQGGFTASWVAALASVDRASAASRREAPAIAARP